MRLKIAVLVVLVLFLASGCKQTTRMSFSEAGQHTDRTWCADQTGHPLIRLESANRSTFRLQVLTRTNLGSWILRWEWSEPQLLRFQETLRSGQCMTFRFVHRSPDRATAYSLSFDTD